ncbi:MAG: cyclopropane-fatty-acyl-phospholipid synthase family protein [Cyanobacteria bacterium REEB67]|nr:cyclopropane-fatty-acyl-phospholipid synthase family protein [Cyanobacteria bacterium REEB67]
MGRNNQSNQSKDANRDIDESVGGTPLEPVPAEVMTWLQETMRASELPLNVSFVFWQGQDFSFMADRETNKKSLKIKINHPGVIGELINAPDLLRAVDLLMDGHIDFSGEIDDLISAFCYFFGKPFAASEDLQTWCRKMPGVDQPALASPDWHKLAVNSPQRDKAVVQYHYDVSNDFYKLWLDPKMLYSCAHFADADDNDLTAAQEAKLDLICRKLQLKKDELFLDIGCGWGALIRWAVKHYGVRAHGITLSKEQLAFNQKWIEAEGLGDRVEVELKDYRELPQTPNYDKISSIGMIEHVGIANYTTYFKNALTALKPGGLFLNHGIALNQIWQPEVSFILKYIFPDAQCPPITTYLQFAKDSGFEIIDVDCWRPHYAKTLRCWAANLDQELEAATAIVGKRIKMWQIYLRFCAQGFENGSSSVYQTLLKRSSDKTWDLPLIRDNWLC